MKYILDPRMLDDFPMEESLYPSRLNLYSSLLNTFYSNILTPEVFEEIRKRYGDRKEEGRLDFVVSVNDNGFYPVPREVEHRHFTPLLNDDKEKLIPSQYRFDGDRLTQIITGASSFEAEFGVLHEPTDLVRAHQLMISLANYINLDIDLKRNEILHIYQKKTTSS